MVLYIKSLIGFVSSKIANVFSYTKEFTKAELQQKIEAMMPLTKKLYFLTIVISDPVLDLTEGSNELGIRVNVQALIPGGLTGDGVMHLTGSISYNPDEGAFYLSNPTLLDLKIKGISDKYQLKIKQFAQATLSNVLLSRPIYTLKDDDTTHQLAKLALESILVKNGKLLIKLRMF